MSDQMKFLQVLSILALLTTSCNSQQTDPSKSGDRSELIGGPCEICHLIDVDMPSVVDAVDTSSAWEQGSPELLVTGTILRSDGKTPAPNVILFYWHTNQDGIYPPPPTPTEADRLGSIKGWIKSDSTGQYTLVTSRPGTYPNRGEPAHIHWLIKEPQFEYAYYIDAMVFDDDELLTTEERKSLENRGGNMILRPHKVGSNEEAEKNIILGLNIPNYPKS